MAERDDFVIKVNQQLSKKKTVTPPWKAPIRIHPWGDFYSNKYAEKWLQIAKDNPNLWFYAYTKSHQMPAIKELEKLPNVKIIQSFDGQNDVNINENKPHCTVFKTHEEFDDYNAKHPGKEYVECKKSDLVAADPANVRIGIILHGKTHNPKGFDIETLGAKGKKSEQPLHFAHTYDQIDAPHNWQREQHDEYNELVEQHTNAGEPFKALVQARYKIMIC